MLEALDALLTWHDDGGARDGLPSGWLAIDSQSELGAAEESSHLAEWHRIDSEISKAVRNSDDAWAVAEAKFKADTWLHE